MEKSKYSIIDPKIDLGDPFDLLQIKKIQNDF